MIKRMMVAVAMAALVFGVGAGLGYGSAHAAESSVGTYGESMQERNVLQNDPCVDPTGRPIAPTGEAPPCQGSWQLYVAKRLNGEQNWQLAVASDFCPEPPPGWSSCTWQPTNDTFWVFDPFKDYCWHVEWVCCNGTGIPVCGSVN